MAVQRRPRVLLGIHSQALVRRWQLAKRVPEALNQLLSHSPHAGRVQRASMFLEGTKLVDLFEQLGSAKAVGLLESMTVVREPSETRANFKLLSQLMDDLEAKEAEELLSRLGVDETRRLLACLPPERAWRFYKEAGGVKGVRFLLNRLGIDRLWLAADALGAPISLALFRGLTPSQAKTLLAGVSTPNIAAAIRDIGAKKTWQLFEEKGVRGLVPYAFVGRKPRKAPPGSSRQG